MKRIRCAIYTRKSSEDGLEQEFNSLHAQRDACAAFITSQRAEGWELVPQPYDDGGISGGTMERPALHRLLHDIDEGHVDQIVVYKIDAAGTSFVSVTQSFNTATSMGRLTLNMLLSFAQFEREVTAERIRDKISASKRKGLWMGGNVPLGYDAQGRTLKINEPEAATVRKLFDLYIALGTVREVKAEADRLGLQSKQRQSPSGRISGGSCFNRGHIQYILTNPVYIGKIRHRKVVHHGQHPAIIEREVWDTVQGQLQARARIPRACIRSTQPSPLVGKLYDETGDRLTPSHTKTRTGKRLRYYVSNRLIKRSGEPEVSVWRLPASELEKVVAQLLNDAVQNPGFIIAAIPKATSDDIVRFRRAISQASLYANPKAPLTLVERVDLVPGMIKIAMDSGRLSEIIGVDAERLASDDLTFSAPFRSRKRGVETKILIANEQRPVDKVLMKNIAKATDWLARLTAGETYADIARSERTAKTRIQQMIGLAFLAPDIVRNIVEGRQPLGLTSDWFRRHQLPANWDEQRKIIVTL